MQDGAIALWQTPYGQGRLSKARRLTAPEVAALAREGDDRAGSMLDLLYGIWQRLGDSARHAVDLLGELLGLRAGFAGALTAMAALRPGERVAEGRSAVQDATVIEEPFAVTPSQLVAVGMSAATGGSIEEA